MQTAVIHWPSLPSVSRPKDSPYPDIYPGIHPISASPKRLDWVMLEETDWGLLCGTWERGREEGGLTRA